MKEIKNILAAFRRAQTEGKRCALATVVHVEGSSYRRPGARMLVTDDGQLTGAISGGCLEGDALQKARHAIVQQQNKLVVYDTMDDDDEKFGVQLGCNGIVYILFEPIDPLRQAHPIRLLEELVYMRSNEEPVFVRGEEEPLFARIDEGSVVERKDAVLVTLFSLDPAGEQPGTSLLLAAGTTRSTLSDGWQSLIGTDVREAYQGRASAFKEYRLDGRIVHGFIEFIPPPPSVVIAGAGNDVLPLVEIMAMLGWQVTVVDGRPQYATTKRFDKADKVVLAKKGDVLRHLTTDPETLFVLMTHNYNYDLALLKELLSGRYPYIGLLGPRKKLEKMLDELAGEGIDLTREQMASIHSPIGLDIGAETAEEIAVSIVAEIRALLSGRSGEFLKNSRQSIHNRAGLNATHG